ncbi:MAG: hypothetical protein A3A26_03145 [Candidatus Zambryskibacteria bacterium RIFCSPLOWO2_01_FULL_47_14]|uniref:Ig-like domain-containing protein n=1 Tax=Candidatus Zambryskibacteria bacterium RIFCSPLOWO2_01_FULL_47_14 TaxID=1802763 RepID=A0A1G2U8X8_9BACT|nr:MAG: hypothetical protein A3A26_03145 [Candidatus Zambryskibacteria bacterium RIFCSPLOWO2_01_FULL_47_14]
MRKLFLLLTIYFLLSTPVFAQSVDILWQGETYAPPFYEGKALWSKQSLIRFVAIPQGFGDPAALNYRWVRNGTVLGGASGIGKDTIKFRDTLFSKPYTLKVEIINQLDETLAESTISMAARDPELLVYEKNPLYGYMFHRQVDKTYRLNKEEVTFSAFPLYADSTEREATALSYKWRTGTDTWIGNSVTYRAPEKAQGYVPVIISFSDSSKVMREITRDFIIQFGDE